jgi:hypothetical protein
VDVARAAGVEEDVALADARLLLEQAGDEQRLPHRLGERSLVAGEPAGQMGELGVVAAPFAHAVEPLQDAARHAASRIGVVVGPRELGSPRLGVERGEDGVLVLLHRRLVGRPAAQRGDVGGHHQRMGDADRLAQVVDVGEDAVGHEDRPRPQAIDALGVPVVGQGEELGVLRIARHVERQAAAEVAGAQRVGAADLDERPDERGDEQPRALVDHVGVRAQAGGGRGDRAQAAVGDPHRDRHGALVARALERELALAAVELGVEQRAHARGPGPLCDRCPQIVHEPPKRYPCGEFRRVPAVP